MNQLFRTSVAAGRLAVGVARIKCTPYLDSPLKRMVSFVRSRSLVNARASSGCPVGNLEMYETGGKKEIDFASIFRKKDTTAHHKCKEISFKSEFTGEVEKQYLEYLAKLERRAFHDHVSGFPRKRSEAEKKVIFDRYVELYKRKYPSDEVKERRYGYFKENLDYIDESNARTPKLCTYGLSDCLDLVTPSKTGERLKKLVEFGPDPFEVPRSAVPYYMLDVLVVDN